MTALTSEANAERRAHVGARADLEVVAEEIMGIVQHLDALNKYRFRSMPEQLAGWASARNVAWAPRHPRVRAGVRVATCAPPTTRMEQPARGSTVGFSLSVTNRARSSFAAG